MGLPSALLRKCRASNRAPSPHPWPLLGLTCVCSWSATKRLAHRSFSTKSLTSGIKKKKKKKHWFPPISTCTCRPACHVPPWLHAHTLTHAGLLNTPTLPIPSPRVTGVITIPFFPNGKPGKMIGTMYVAKRLASTGSEGEKNWVVYFFSCL